MSQFSFALSWSLIKDPVDGNAFERHPVEGASAHLASCRKVLSLMLIFTMTAGYYLHAHFINSACHVCVLLV